MKLSTAIINTIEMTREEEHALWNTAMDDRVICGKKVKHWLTDDGHNSILLEGETSYREVVRIK